MTVNIPIHPSIPNYPSNLSAQHGGIHCNITVKFKLYPPIHTCICMYVCTWYASFFFSAIEVDRWRAQRETV